MNYKSVLDFNFKFAHLFEYHRGLDKAELSHIKGKKVKQLDQVSYNEVRFPQVEGHIVRVR